MKCKNIIYNDRETELDEKLDGIMDARPGELCRVENLHSHTMYQKAIPDDRVQIVINGGGGYGPLFAGFVGEGLAQAVCEGDFDCAPNAYALYDVAKTIHRGKGILFLANNFTGDYLNNDMAQELLRTEGILSEAVYASDDICSARGEPKENRGGLSGIGLLIKAASSAAAAGLPLAEVARIARKANDALRSITVRLNEAMDTMEFGPGFSGEPPAFSAPFVSADDLARRALDCLLGELNGRPSIRYDYIVNRMRDMTYVEGYVLLHAVKRRLLDLGLPDGHCASGCYFDAFEGKGCTVSLLAADEELARYLAPVQAHDFSI